MELNQLSDSLRSEMTTQNWMNQDWIEIRPTNNHLLILTKGKCQTLELISDKFDKLVVEVSQSREN